MEIITLVTAIVGCVTGVSSLLLSWYKIFSEKPRLNIESPLPFLNGFIDNEDLHYNSSKSLIITLRLINLGISPLSVKNVYITFNRKKLYPSDSVPKNIEFEISNIKDRIHPLPTKIHLPALLKSAAILDATFCFRIADDLYATVPSKVTVAVETAKSVKKRTFEVMDLSAENIDNYIFEHEHISN